MAYFIFYDGLIRSSAIDEMHLAHFTPVGDAQLCASAVRSCLKKPRLVESGPLCGTPCWIRTSDLQFRRLLL